MANLVVAVNQVRKKSIDHALRSKRSVNPLDLIQSSFSSRKVSRQFPLLAGLHRATDGALIGVLIAVALMSTLALHWQQLWTIAFTRLERTRDLAHRLTESTAMLERHLLLSTSLPKSMVPTKAINLLYLDSPKNNNQFQKNNYQKFFVLKRDDYQPINHGY